jgi:hypothetical protein
VAGTENKYFTVLLTKSLRKWNQKNNSIIFKVLRCLFTVKWNEKVIAKIKKNWKKILLSLLNDDRQ